MPAELKIHSRPLRCCTRTGRSGYGAIEPRSIDVASHRLMVAHAHAPTRSPSAERSRAINPTRHSTAARTSPTPKTPPMQTGECGGHAAPAAPHHHQPRSPGRHLGPVQRVSQRNRQSPPRARARPRAGHPTSVASLNQHRAPNSSSTAAVSAPKRPRPLLPPQAALYGPPRPPRRDPRPPFDPRKPTPRRPRLRPDFMARATTPASDSETNPPTPCRHADNAATAACIPVSGSAISIARKYHLPKSLSHAPRQTGPHRRIVAKSRPNPPASPSRPCAVSEIHTNPRLPRQELFGHDPNLPQRPWPRCLRSRYPLAAAARAAPSAHPHSPKSSATNRLPPLSQSKNPPMAPCALHPVAQ
jgi:hypothetical protein